MNVPEFLDTLQLYLPATVHRQLSKLVSSSNKVRDSFLALLPSALTLSILSIYTYWNYVVLPDLFLDSDGGFWYYFCYTGGAYVFHGICGHYYLMSFRKSFVPDKYMVPFEIDCQEENATTTSRGEEGDGEVKQENDATKVYPVKSVTSYFETLGLPIPCASTDWHPCFICQAFVCPGSFHCEDCSRCILRRDHHCVFSRSCIGEKNHVNFFGFIFHMVLGTIASGVTGIIVDYHRFGPLCVYKYMKSLCWYMGGFLEIENFFFYALFQLVFVGVVVTSIHLVLYLNMCARGQTAWERRRARMLSLTSPVGSYVKFEEFLGPNAMLRILFPLCFSAPPETLHDRIGFIRNFNEMKTSSKIPVRISLTANY